MSLIFKIIQIPIVRLQEDLSSADTHGMSIEVSQFTRFLTRTHPTLSLNNALRIILPSEVERIDQSVLQQRLPLLPWPCAAPYPLWTSVALTGDTELGWPRTLGHHSFPPPWVLPASQSTSLQALS